MKCPWRPVQVKEPAIRNIKEHVRTDFAECYKGECPFYSPVRKISSNLSTVEGCRRTKLEEKK